MASTENKALLSRKNHTVCELSSSHSKYSFTSFFGNLMISYGTTCYVHQGSSSFKHHNYKNADVHRTIRTEEQSFPLGRTATVVCP